MTEFEMIQPDDWHVHFRDGLLLPLTVNHSAQYFGRGLAMPNLKTPLTTFDALHDYHQRLKANLFTENLDFKFYLTLYLNEAVSTDDIIKAKSNPSILGAKFYPAGATTHSEQGAKSLRTLYPLLEALQDNELVLQVHGEVTHGDIFEREKLFIEEYLIQVLRDFPRLKIVFEHISTKAAVDFVIQAPKRLAATITPHHLYYQRNDLLVGGLKPHLYCLPILKSAQDQNALLNAAMSGNPKFFAGTDSAPHLKTLKESACGCAGIYSAPYALSLYTQCFENQNKLNLLEGFMSRFGAAFYHLPLNKKYIRIKKLPLDVAKNFKTAEGSIIPIAAGTSLNWSAHVL